MSKTVTLRLDEATYTKFRHFANSDNRALSNFIETSTLRYITEHEYVDEFEMAEIATNAELQKSLARAHADAKAKRGKFVEGTS